MEESSFEECDGDKPSSPPTINLVDEDLNITDAFPMPKSKRTSRLTCGRKERKTAVFQIAPDLHKTIPVTLPEHERLSRLLEDAFEFSMLAVCQELESGENSEVVERREKCLGDIKLYFGRSNICKLIVTDDDEWRKEESFSLYYAHMDKLKAESEKWDELFLKTRKEFQVKANDPSPVEDNLINLEKEMKIYDYTNVLFEAESVCEEFMQSIHFLVEILNMLKYSDDLFPRYFKCLNDYICRRVHQDFSETPRSLLIRNVQTCLRSKKS